MTMHQPLDMFFHFPTLHTPSPMSNTTLLSTITPKSLQLPIYYTTRPSLIPHISDKYLSIALPIVIYWVLSLIFHLLDTAKFSYFEARRIHESPEVLSRNRATVKQVITAVIWQQVLQVALGWVWLEDDEVILKREFGRDHLGLMAGLAPKVGAGVLMLLGERTGENVLKNHGEAIVRFVYWWGIPIAQMLFAFFIIDTWQYFLHRLFHTSKFLYRHFHSVHHRLYVPYAFGALYNHPVEGLLLDLLGAVIAQELSRMSLRQACLLFSLSSIKTIDDHCGYRLWWDPCQMFFVNNVDYHDMHHQAYGIKKNFSQPFFTNWDTLLGTRMTREEAARKTKRVMKEE